MPTCLAAAGVEYPYQYNDRPMTPPEGKSLVGLFDDDLLVRNKPIFWEHEGNRAVRAGQWKLVSRHNRPWELYDMETDRTELNNLVHDQPGLVKEMAALYQQWAKRCNVVAWPPKRK